MDYIELLCTIPNDYENTSAVVIAMLAEEGFESFIDEIPVLKAYCQQSLFDAERINDLCLSEYFTANAVSVSVVKVEQQNWNSTWESNYEPIEVGGRCLVRAPFHQTIDGIEYEIVITPKMSFGTGHHETTRLMIATMLELDLKGKSVVDCGCGTGVLAIMAAKQGARPVFGFDIEDWAVENTIENNQNNAVEYIEVRNGGLELLQGRQFEVVIANINRNILMSGMELFSQSLKSGNVLLLSGFYEADIKMISEAALVHGLEYQNHKMENNWVACKFIKH